MTNDNEERFLNHVENSSPAWEQAAENARDRMEKAESTETEELSKPSLDAQIEELERDYDRYNRATESNSGGRVWADMADDVREELVDLKIKKAEELANKHDAMSHDDFIGAGREKKRVYSEFQCVKGEVEELQAAGER